MIAVLRQSLLGLRFVNSSSLCESSYVGFTLPLLRFSTSAEGKSAVGPTVYEFLVHKHHFSPESAAQISTVVTRFTNPEKSDSVLSFLRDTGFSISQLEKTVKCRPQLLSGNLEKYIKPKIKIFHEFGLSADDAVEIISNDSTILKHSLNNRFIRSLSVLKNLLGSSGLAKILKASGWVLKTNLDYTLVPNVELLKKCGVSIDRIILTMCRHPRFLLRKPEDMQKFVEKADEMGVNRSSLVFTSVVAVLSCNSDRTLELKRRALQEVGFSDDDIGAIFRKSPTVFLLTPERIKEVIEVLLANGKYGISCIVCIPVSLKFSVGKRYKPRLQVLELLEAKHLIQSWPSLSTLCMMTDEKFYKKYVAPFVDEIGDVYTVRKTASA